MVYLEVRPLRVVTEADGRAWDLIPVLAFASPADARRACSFMPKIAEAFVQASVLAVPVTKKGVPKSDGLSQRLQQRAVRVLGAGAPRQVHLALGKLRDVDFRDALHPFPKPRRCADLVNATGKG